MIYRHSLVFLCVLVLAGCEEKKSPATKSDAGPPSEGPALDPSLARAVQAASASSKSGKAPSADQGGPPATGVFAPGRADKEMPQGSPASITLGSEGSEPRVLVTEVQPKPGSKQTASLQLEIATGPTQGLPPIEFALNLQAQKAAAGSSADAGAGSADQVAMVATVSSVRVVEASRIPKEFSAELAKLKGSKVEYEIAKNGAGNDFRYSIAKGADPGLDNAIRSLTETIATLTLPFPDKPLGNGAYFMATTRERSIGVDVVAYRLVKVTGVKGDKLSLSISTKRYATSSKFEMPGLPQDLGTLTLEEFRSTADGTLDVQKSTPFPINAQLTQLLDAEVSAQKRPDQRMSLQVQARAAFVLGGAPAPGSAK